LQWSPLRLVLPSDFYGFSFLRFVMVGLWGPCACQQLCPGEFQATIGASKLGFGNLKSRGEPLTAQGLLASFAKVAATIRGKQAVAST